MASPDFLRNTALLKAKRPPGVTGNKSEVRCSLQRREPDIDILPGLVFRVSVPLLQTTFQLVTLTIDRCKIVIGKLSPFLFTLPLTSFQFPSTRFQSIGFSSH
jgi:hypothetical protein